MAMTCPKGHPSTDPDYCSECGAKMASAPSGITAAQDAAPIIMPSSGGGAGELCPDCGTPRANASATFCEVCRYNFVTKASWAPQATASAPPPVAPVTVAASSTGVLEGSTGSDAPIAGASPDAGVPDPLTMPSAPNAALPIDAGGASTAPAVSAEGAVLRWEADVRVDPTLYSDPDPNVPLPTNEPDRNFHLDFAENLIGRRSDRRDIHPEIALTDPGVSHRHAKLLREGENRLILLDVGSTNGTQLNGVEVGSGVRTPVQDGDEITVGCWTRITLRGIRS